MVQLGSIFPKSMVEILRIILLCKQEMEIFFRMESGDLMIFSQIKKEKLLLGMKLCLE